MTRKLDKFRIQPTNAEEIEAIANQKSLTPEEIAYHEAGHVGVGFAVGHYFNSVTILASEDGIAGIAKSTDFWAAWARHPHKDKSHRTKKPVIEGVKNSILVRLGGGIAEAKFTGKPLYLCGMGTDYEVAEELAAYLWKQPNRLVRKMLYETERIVEVQWKFIQKLADVLVEKKSLNKDELVDFYHFF